MVSNLSHKILDGKKLPNKSHKTIKKYLESISSEKKSKPTKKVFTMPKIRKNAKKSQSKEK